LRLGAPEAVVEAAVLWLPPSCVKVAEAVAEELSSVVFSSPPT